MALDNADFCGNRGLRPLGKCNRRLLESLSDPRVPLDARARHDARLEPLGMVVITPWMKEQRLLELDAPEPLGVCIKIVLTLLRRNTPWHPCREWGQDGESCIGKDAVVDRPKH